MQLSDLQKEELYRDGYVRIPGAIDRERIDTALRFINHHIGLSDPQRLSAAEMDAPITDLFNLTPAREIMTALIGEAAPANAGQIALRYPMMTDAPPPLEPHLDGMPAPANNVPKGTIGNFTAFSILLLSELTGPWAGNFTVWPGTHRQYEQYFREHGWRALLEGMPPIEMPEPVQITGTPGDLIVCHYQMAHCAAANLSPHIRYAVIFRHSHARHKEWDKAPMTDIWMEWPGMAPLADAQK